MSKRRGYRIDDSEFDMFDRIRECEIAGMG
jgi:hypothetical protein